MLELHDLSVIYCYGIIDQLLYYSTKISRFTKTILILIKENEHYIKHTYKQTCNNSLKILNFIYYNAILQQVQMLDSNLEDNKNTSKNYRGIFITRNKLFSLKFSCFATTTLFYKPLLIHCNNSF